MASFPIGLVDTAKQWTGAAAATISLTAQMFNGNNRADYTFTGQSIGTAATNRVIAATVYTSAAGDATSVTIGGISATKVCGYNDAASREMSIWYAEVPTGTTATVFVQLPDEAGRCGVVLYRIIPGLSATPQASGAGNIATLNLTEITGGVTIYTAVNLSGSADFTYSRNGSALTPDVSSLYSASNLVKIGKVSVTGFSNTKQDSVYATGLNNGSMAIAHWR